MDWFWLTTLLLVGVSRSEQDFQACSEISREFRFPCSCSLGPIESALDNNPSISVNCDNMVFSGDFPFLPYGSPVVSFSQREAGYQVLPTQLFASSGLRLRTLDLSSNSLRRLTERILEGIRMTLVELRLANNLLGDTLNPIFSSNEFHGLGHLQILDLSGNSIKAIEEGILEGCLNLQELYLDRNSLTSIPGSSLNGPNTLKILSLRENRIGIIRNGAFQSQSNLELIDLSHNLISTVESGALLHLNGLKFLHLSHNRLMRFNSDVFQGADDLQLLDLSENLITEFPTVALEVFTALRYLNLSSNLIQSLDNNYLQSLTSLYHLDLSRNNIANLGPGTFLGLKQLKKLDLSVNSLRTIEDDAFEALDNLEHLNLKDNNILLIPASALGRLPQLRSLHLDYNRVAALSGDILLSVAERVTELVLARNVVRELPSGSFQHFKQLERLDLTGNLLFTLNTDAFSGLENTLKTLSLAQNRIANVVGPALSLANLETLDLSKNNLSEISQNKFFIIPSLKYLNLSYNPHLSVVNTGFLHQLFRLKVVDLSHIGLATLTKDLFQNYSELKAVYLSHNFLTEITEGAFSNMPNLTTVDLSFNNINNVRQGAFVNVMNIKELSLRSNKLISFKGEFFNTGTSLELLDISANQLSYLFPSSFRIHPRLKEIRAARNKLNFFPSELIVNLQFLEKIDLSDNELKTIEEMDFARLPRLNTLILARNQLETVSEISFLNSTQLQILDLSYNKLERLGERTFEGLIRLKLLDLKGNVLTDLPDTIFERVRLQMLENINLAHNLFEVAPLQALQRQNFFLVSVDLSWNYLREIPVEDNILVNIRKLDLSFNPLSEKTVRNVLGEPKVVRELNMAGTGMKEVIQLEAPFLKALNLSYNNITQLSDSTFERTTLLETLDLSHNQIENISSFTKSWQRLTSLQTLNVSVNPIHVISHNDFTGLDTLRYLSMHSLESCEKVEKGAFKFIPNLSFLKAFGYPKLGYLDVKGLLQNVQSLEIVHLETKDASVGSDQLQSILHPRLKELGLYGPRLKSLSSGTLTGIKGPNIIIRIRNSSLTSLPPGLFFSMPRSSRVVLDVTGSKLTTLSSQILATLDDRRGDLTIEGLESNLIVCDCGSRALHRWLPAQMTTIRCSAPEHLKGRLLVNIGDDELTCDPQKVTTTTLSTIITASSTKLWSKSTEPEIIWSVPVTENANAKMSSTDQSGMGNDDTLIIGIVGGVVAFIAILIIIICIIRLRMGGNQYGGEALMMGPAMMSTGSNCACSVKAGASLYQMPPAYNAGYAATLPHRMQTPSLRPSNYSTMGRVPYYQTSAQPYFIAYSPDEKTQR